MVQSNEVTVADVVRLDGFDAPCVILDIEPEAGLVHVLPIDVSQVRTVLMSRIVAFGDEEGRAGDASTLGRDAA